MLLVNGPGTECGKLYTVFSVELGSVQHTCRDRAGHSGRCNQGDQRAY